MKESQSPKVLHTCKVFLPVKGGVQRVVSNITSLLSRYSHTVITTGEDGAVSSEKIDRAEVFRCRSFGQIASMPIAPTLITKVAKQLRHFQLVAVHYPFPLAELALLFAFRAPPIVVHWHSDIIAQKRLKWLVAPLTLLMLLRAKAIVVTSECMLERSFFLRRFRRKLVFVPYGLKPLYPTPDTRPADKNYFLIVGRHVSYKGIDIAIRALQHNSLQLVIAGDGPLYEQHLNLATELGVANQVRFERHASDADIIVLMLHCTALVVPSVMENEAFALVQLEAMRLAKAVINTKLESSVPWVARHQQEALTVLPGDVGALAEAMLTLRSEPDTVERLGDNGLRRYRQQFSAEHFSTALDELYATLINNGQVHPATKPQYPE